MKKILFVVDEYRVGGVTTVLCNLLKVLDKKKYQLDLLILNKEGMLEDNIPQNINILETSSFFDVCDKSIKECQKRGFNYLLKKIKLLLLIKTSKIHSRIKKERALLNIKDYDIEIAFKEGISTIFIINGNSKKKINWIHSDYKIKNYAHNYMKTMKDVFRKVDINIAVSKVVKHSFEEIFDVNNVITINNIIDIDNIKKLKEEEEFNYPQDIFTFLAVGRLHPQKSYDRLLKVCKRLNDEGYIYQLYILGDGELKEELFKQKEENHLDNIYFMLNQNNPYRYMNKADMLVLSSLYEGLPTVVSEALVCELPVISTDVAGIKEQLNDDIGMVVENNIDALYEGLKYILDHQEIVKKYKKNLKKQTYQNIDNLKKIEELFNES